MEDLMRQCTDAEGRITDDLLDALRKCCHKPENAVFLFKNQKFYESILSLDDSPLALKVVANVLFHDVAAREHFANHPQYQVLLDSLIIDKHLLLTRLRIVFLTSINEMGCLKAFNYLDLFNELALEQNDPLIVIELLRILYNIAKFKNAKDPNIFWSCLSRFPDNISIIGNVFNFGVNLHQSDLLQTIPSEDIAIDLLKKSLKLLTPLYDDKNSHLDALAFIPSQMLSITKLTDNSNYIRHSFRKWILPSKFDRNLSVDKGSDMKACLARFLASPNDRLSLSTGEFLYSLCNHQVPRLIFHFGYGVTAGFLYSKNLLGNFEALSTVCITNPKDLSSDEEELSNTDIVGIDPVTAMSRSNLPRDEQMTDEEKEVEARKLMELLDRLDKTGVIKLYSIERDN